MTDVVRKFFTTSMLMWKAPIVILNGFNNNLFPGSNQLSSHSLTILSGFLVISVNIEFKFIP
ncbi:hypothetical protein MKW98_002421 [Papaver atlanticum]|uniref:Uncharacterized protein n=1 Tax=Papaver atlanticum TaxID=357466 RepID=A0AAD4SBC7_9MAGN|nr:hypothetical protein MKW98_002421 [Papaver atlanticum]